MSGRFWDKGPMVVTGCTKVSPGCKNCWSEQAHRMRMHNPTVAHVYRPESMTLGGFNGKVQFNFDLLEKAVRGDKPQTIAIWNDLYHEGVTDEQISSAFKVMAEAKHHTFLIITKRPERWVTHGNIWSNIWHITTCENQAMADERIPHLLKIPGNRGVIIEPMLGPVDLFHIREDTGHTFNALSEKIGISFRGERIHQVICGAETGSNKRPINLDWVRSIRDQAITAGVPFFFKVDSDSKREIDGREHNDLAWEQRD